MSELNKLSESTTATVTGAVEMSCNAVCTNIDGNGDNSADPTIPTEESVLLTETIENDEEPIRLADESGSESGEMNLRSITGEIGHNRSHSSSSDNFTDARMDTPDNDENASSCLPSIPSELQLDSLSMENMNCGNQETSNGDGNSLTVSIAKIDELDEDFKTPDVEMKAFGISLNTNTSETLVGSDAAAISQKIEHKKGAISCVPVGTPELCKSGSIHADLENLEDYGDEQFVNDVGESIQVKNVEVDVLMGDSQSPEQKNCDASRTKKALGKNKDEEAEDVDDDFSDSSIINSIDRATSSESPHSPQIDGLQRRRNSSIVQASIGDGDAFPNEQILDYLVDVNDDVMRF